MRSSNVVFALVVALAVCPWRAGAERPDREPGLGAPDRLTDGTWSVDESAIRADREGDGVRVTVPVASGSPARTMARLSARIEWIEGDANVPWAVGAASPLPGSSPPAVLIPGVPASVWDRPQGMVLAWTLALGDVPRALSGRAALGRAQQPLRVLVSLAPRLTRGVPVPFQATVTRADGTAAAGARFVVRSDFHPFLDWGGAAVPDWAAGVTVFEGLTDALGSVAGRLDPGAVSGAYYAFEAEIDGRRTVAERWLEFVEPEVAAGRLIAATDKPSYQPSQDVHVRVLALRPGDGRPATGARLVHAVRDPRGTLVHREEMVVDRFGITHFVFPLADELLLGEYRVDVTGDDHAASVPFKVDRYELPRFSSVVSTDEPYATPGGEIRGRVDVSYVFGAPVRGARVTVDLLRREGDAEPQSTDTGRAGPDGTARFRLSVPSHFSGQDLREGAAAVTLRVRAVDAAGQTAETTRRVPVSEGPLTIRVVPEAGELVPGIGNVLHVAVSDPAGRPVEADLSVTLGGATLGAAATDSRGYARLLTGPLDAPGDLVVTARADAGARTASRTIAFTAPGPESYLLARPDRSMTGAGEPLGIDLLCSADVSSVTIDLRSGGELLETRTVPVAGGTARADFVATADAVGELGIHARALGGGGRLLQDRRTVVVDVGDDLAVAVTPDRAQYGPGEPALLSVEVRDPRGDGVEAEVGITAVDEAVYLLTAGRAGAEALGAGATGLDGTETFGGGASLGDLLAGGRAQEDQDLAAAILAARPARGREADSRATAAARETYAGQWPLYFEGRRIAALLRPLDRSGRRAAVRAGGFVDPWGTAYDISIRGRPREVRVTSAGADETFGTADDLTYVYRLRRPSGHVADAFVNFDAGAVFGTGRGEGGLFGGVTQSQDGGYTPAAPGPGAEPVQARRFFPETLLAVPDVLTDAAGRASLPFTLADNVTTWRVAALASTQDGLLGSGTSSLRVVKDLFVDVGLPRRLTQGDRIEIPVVAYNLTGAETEVTLSLTPGAWFEAVAGASRRVLVPAGSAARSSFEVRVVGAGDVTLRVDAEGGGLADAVEMPSAVVPDARPVSFTRSGRVDAAARETVEIPAAAIAGQTSMTVHVLPGVLSQTLDGLDAMLAEPYGCFEQTTSTTYPNAVVLDYLETSGAVRPDVSARARRFLTQGIERLLTFEVEGGGFSLWGDAPASEILSAYAVQEFEDIAKVRFVDPALIDRTAAWLVGRQDADGAWRPGAGGVHFGESTDALRVTAYVAWVLADAGRAPAAVGRALAFVRANEAGTADLYTRVVVANALLAADPDDAVGRTVLGELLSERRQDQRGTYWEYGTQGWRGMLTSSGAGADVEATAMMVQALLATGGHADVITDVLRFLAGARSDHGGWGGTFATVWTIKAFVRALPASSGTGGGSVEIRVNGRAAAGVPVDPQGVPQAIDVSAFVVPGSNTVDLVALGGAEPFYRISGRYMLPWSEPVPEPEALDVSVRLEPRDLRAGRRADLTLRIRNARAFGDAEQVTAVVALPPGFTVDESRLRDLRAQGEIDRFEVQGGLLNLYLGRIPERGVRELRVRVHPTLRGDVVLPHTTAYEYYDPGSRGVSAPRRVRIR